MASPTVAANAYASLARMMDSGAAGGKAPGGDGTAFSAVLKDVLGGVMEAGGRPMRRRWRWRRARPT